jgi:hypothetical protein
MAEKPAADASSIWLSIRENVFAQWYDHLGSSEAARSKLEALLRDPETRSAKQRISASGEVTRDLLPTHFWEDSASLWVLTNVDDGIDYLEIHWPDYEDIYHGRSEFLVRRADVERWERLHPVLAALPPAPSKEKAKPGPKPDFDWEKIEAKCHDLMDENGDFMPDDPEWDCQARLEEALMNFCDDTWKREPSESTLRAKLPGWLSAWRKRKTGDA